MEKTLEQKAESGEISSHTLWQVAQSKPEPKPPKEYDRPIALKIDLTRTKEKVE